MNTNRFEVLEAARLSKIQQSPGLMLIVFVSIMIATILGCAMVFFKEITQPTSFTKQRPPEENPSYNQVA